MTIHLEFDSANEIISPKSDTVYNPTKPNRHTSGSSRYP